MFILVRCMILPASRFCPGYHSTVYSCLAPGLCHTHSSPPGIPYRYHLCISYRWYIIRSLESKFFCITDENSHKKKREAKWLNRDGESARERSFRDQSGMYQAHKRTTSYGEDPREIGIMVCHIMNDTENGKGRTGRLHTPINYHVYLVDEP